MASGRRLAALAPVLLACSAFGAEPLASTAPASVYAIPHTEYQAVLPPYPGMADLKKGGFLVWDFVAADQKGRVTVHLGTAYETSLDDMLASETVLGRRRMGPVRGRHLGRKSAYWEIQRSTAPGRPNFYEKRTYELLKRGDKGLVEVYYQFEGPPELASVAWKIYGPVFHEIRCSLRLQNAKKEPRPADLEEGCADPPK